MRIYLSGQLMNNNIYSQMLNNYCLLYTLRLKRSHNMKVFMKQMWNQKDRESTEHEIKLAEMIWICHIAVRHNCG